MRIHVIERVRSTPCTRAPLQACALHHASCACCTTQRITRHIHGHVCAAFHPLQTGCFRVVCSGIWCLCREFIRQRHLRHRIERYWGYCTNWAVTVQKRNPSATIAALVGAGTCAFNGVSRRETTSCARSAHFDKHAHRRMRLSGMLRRSITPHACASMHVQCNTVRA